jgi:hypothetical protein
MIDELAFAASVSGEAVIACADDNVIRLTPAAKTAATSTFIRFSFCYLQILFMSAKQSGNGYIRAYASVATGSRVMTVDTPSPMMNAIWVNLPTQHAPRISHPSREERITLPFRKGIRVNPENPATMAAPYSARSVSGYR